MPTETAKLNSTNATDIHVDRPMETPVFTQSGHSRVRDANLDLIRAAAIILVLVNHLGIVWPEPIPVLTSVSSLGVYGVDLFFVLSGWLIGSLFWTESYAYGRVQCDRFWLRRVMRTVPPYLTVLPITWFAAFVFRSERFDPRYLFFLQNYRKEIPFFSASWSLCVEEHFYLLLPIAAALMFQNRRAIVELLIFLALVSPCARWFDSSASPSAQFGYADTATHFRFTGLAIGTLCSYIAIAIPQVWNPLYRLARISSPVLFAAWISIPWWPASSRFYLGYELSSLLAASLLILIAGRPALRISRMWLTTRLARWSYSIYLTHGLILQAAAMIRKHEPSIPNLIQIAVASECVLFVGFLFYHMVELPSIRMRDRLVPRRPEIAV